MNNSIVRLIRKKSISLVLGMLTYGIHTSAIANDVCEFRASTAHTAAQMRDEGKSMEYVTTGIKEVLDALEKVKPETRPENWQIIRTVGWVFMYSLPTNVFYKFTNRACREERGETAQPISTDEKEAICKLYSRMAYGALLNKLKGVTRTELLVKIGSQQELHEKTMFVAVKKSIGYGYSQVNKSPKEVEGDALADCKNNSR